jgi:uncharacterized repeat protein (TIGR02543 family)
MHKKILRIASALLVLLVFVSLLPDNASSVATTEAERISALATSTYKKALKRTGRSSFHGWCGAAVDQQMQVLGITTKVVGTDGNQKYDYFKKMDYTSGGYKVKAYSVSKYSLEKALKFLSEDGTKNVYNIMVGFQRTNTSAGRKYGHAVFIYAIIDGDVYFTESFDLTISGKRYPEGQCVVTSIAEFAKSYNSWCKYEGLIHFGLKTYEEECLFLNAYLYANTTTDTTLYSSPCTPDVDERSHPLRQLQAGERLSVIGMYRNTQGEYWYQVEDAQICYVRADDTEVQAMRYDDVAIDAVKAPTVLTEGSSFSIKGSVTGQYVSINSVRAQVYQVTEDGMVHKMTTNAPVSANDYTLYKSKVAMRLTFKLLDIGSYHYELAAVVSNHYYADGALQTDWQTIKLWKSDFQVVEKKGETANVKFDAGEGVSELDAAELTLGHPLTYLPQATREGYVFDGWYTADGEKVDEEFVLEGKMTLYAKWTAAGDVTGWYEENGRTYYVQDGVRVLGFFQVDGITYFQGAEGYLSTGWVTIDGERCYFNTNGSMVTGWLRQPEGTYYLGVDGTMAIGWVDIDDQTYYFEPNGLMVTGIKVIGGTKYYFGDNGALIRKAPTNNSTQVRPGITTFNK